MPELPMKIGTELSLLRSDGRVAIAIVSSIMATGAPETSGVTPRS